MAEALPPPSVETVQQILAEFGLNEQSLKEAIEVIKDWVKLQPHLPKEDDDGRLERWIIRCKNSLERTKKSLDTYYTVKTMIPELMAGWDPTSKWFRTVAEIGYYIPMPQLTPDYDRVTVIGYHIPDTTDLIGDDFLKLMLMILDVRNSEDYNSSNIFVIDLKNYTIGHLPKITLPSLKKTEVCGMRGFNIRMKALHLINTPPFSDVFIGLLKSVFKSKLAARIYVHGSDLSSLHEQVPKECLPTECGGEGGSIAKNWSAWKKKLESYQAWFKEHESLKSDENKRPGGVIDSGEFFGFEGSFRKLNVD